MKNFIIFLLAIAIIWVSTYGWRAIWRKPTAIEVRVSADADAVRQNLKDELTKNLQHHVYTLSATIGDRSVFNYSKLQDAEAYITEKFRSYGYQVKFQEYQLLGKTVKNIIATKVGAERHSQQGEEYIVIGAHYDTHFNPGADDNASGVAGLLELAKLLANEKPRHAIQFVAFVNEEPPFFKTENMGSRVFVKLAKAEGVKIIAMLSLEMLGYYNEQANSQRYPPFLGFFFPNRANFISVISNFSSRWLAKKITNNWQKNIVLPVVSFSAFSFIPGVDFSDQWSFWKEKIPAAMITDTAFYRYKHYHGKGDTYEKLDYQKMAEVVIGLRALVVGW